MLVSHAHHLGRLLAAGLSCFVIAGLALPVGAAAAGVGAAAAQEQAMPAPAGSQAQRHGKASAQMHKGAAERHASKGRAKTERKHAY